ncbi:uncharacterized protein [Nicotiana sylvestris]|uniref:uncharacterized protein n=1 Tax=Nicotiana sylvestris TaxID=4096 RepID=UPI00388C7153
MVASGALSKKLNEQLKESQAQDSDSELYKSSSEEERPGSSDSETAQESLLSGKKSGGSISGEAAEGLVNLSSQGDEPGSSVQETLTDLLKKVGASYDPKKRRTPTPKAPSAPKPSKKQKASSPTPTETSLTKGRATRSRTPKPKRPKTSSKKFSSVSEAPELSLAKRTKSAVKSKQVRVSEDEEWSGDEESESDGEQDKVAMFGKRKILKARLLKDLVEPGMVRLVDTLAAKGWKDMVLQMDGRLA